MAKKDIKHYSRDEIRTLKAKGKVWNTPADAPKFEPDENFWKQARIVKSHSRRKSSVHLRLDPEILSFYRSGGPGHLTRMASVLRAYAEGQE